jgi:hypothetical protein
MRELIAIAIAASSLAACSTQTTYRLRSGHEVRGEITGRIGNTIEIRTESRPRTIEVDVCDVVDVDHPGKAAAITGTVLLGVGAAVLGTTIAAVATDTGSMRHGIARAVLATGGAASAALIVPGGVLAGWGYTYWSDSKSEAADLKAGCEESRGRPSGVRSEDEPPPLTRHSRLRRPDVTTTPASESPKP